MVNVFLLLKIINVLEIFFLGINCIVIVVDID